MTYQEYFRQTNFDEIWLVLNGFYNEPEETRPLYENLVKEIIDLPIDEAHCDETIKMSHDCHNEIKVAGAPAPQEWLAGREVMLASAQSASRGDIAAHLLYWSTLYGIKTSGQYWNEFSGWLKSLAAGPYYDEDGMVKYIFLDFDGALNTEQYQAELHIAGCPTADEYGPLFDPKAVACLGEIIDATKAKIVVTSSWRYIHDKDVLSEMWKKRGLPGKIYCFLPTECSENNRGKEIKEFIAHETNTPYVIIDNSDEILPEQKEAYIEVNPLTGISQNDVNKAVEILNRFDNKPLSYFINSSAEKDREQIERIESESRKKKRIKYWRDTIYHDSAIDWSWNLMMLKKKLEYNIGYWRYVQRHEGWEEDVKRMQLCSRLLELAATDYPDMAGVYVNERNAARYGITVEHDELLEVHLEDLRREKAYRIAWRFIEHNMKEWWN